MKKIQILKRIGLTAVILFSLFSCSKDSGILPGDNDELKSGTTGDKVFTGGNHEKQFTASKFNTVFTKFNGSNHFSSGGGNHFSGGSGGGGGNQGGGAGSMTLGGQTISFVAGAFFNYEDGWFDLIFIDKNPTIAEPVDYNLIGFELISSSTTTISQGEYHYSETEMAFTFPYAWIILNGNTPDEFEIELTNGTVTFTGNLQSCSVTFEGILEGDIPVTGFFSGSLFDISDDPEPPPTYSMSAYVDGVQWSATYVYASESYYGFSIFGQKDQYEYISLMLASGSAVTGAQLTFQNEGLIGAVYTTNQTQYVAYDVGVVNITSFTGSTVSGTFSFEGYDYNSGDYLSVSNGVFNNVPVQTQ